MNLSPETFVGMLLKLANQQIADSEVFDWLDAAIGTSPA